MTRKIFQFQSAVLAPGWVDNGTDNMLDKLAVYLSNWCKTEITTDVNDPRTDDFYSFVNEVYDIGETPRGTHSPKLDILGHRFMVTRRKENACHASELYRLRTTITYMGVTPNAPLECPSSYTRP